MGFPICNSDGIRGCVGCGRPITRSFGFAKAGDLLEYWDGRREAIQIRELCGPCSMTYRWTPEGRLERYNDDLMEATSG